MTLEDIIYDIVEQLECVLKEEDVSEAQGDCINDAITVLLLALSEEVEETD